MRSNWKKAALIVSWLALCHAVSSNAQIPDNGQPLLQQDSQQAPLSSSDYLKLMEQANMAAGIESVGGNFVGAKPRPRGSLDSPSASVGALPQAIPAGPFATEPHSAPNPAAPFAPHPTVTNQPPPLHLPNQLPSEQQLRPTQRWSPSAQEIPLTSVPESTMNAGLVSVDQAGPPAGSNPPTNWSSARELAEQPWTGPRWLGSYASIGWRRPGDESLTLSPTGELGTFGADQASQISIGYMTNPIDCYEMTYLGSLRWNRSLESIGPIQGLVSSNDPQWLYPFQNADSLSQTHSAGFRQYSLGRRWLTDDIGNSAFGLRVIDYNEEFRMRSKRQDQEGLYSVQTGNLLVGLGRSIELWRPISQRVALGGQVDGGLYANFADAHFQASSGDDKESYANDDDLSLAASLGVHLKARYQLRSWAGLYGGYRWLMVTGLASVDDQALPSLSDNITLSTSSDATILFHGFDAGLEFKF